MAGPESGILPKPQEAQHLGELEQSLRTAIVSDKSGSTHGVAAGARAALQAEVDKLTTSDAVKRDHDFLTRVDRQLVINDVLGMKTPDHHCHYPAVKIVDGQMILLSNDKIAADEKVAQQYVGFVPSAGLPEETRKFMGFTR